MRITRAPIPSGRQGELRAHLSCELALAVFAPAASLAQAPAPYEAPTTPPPSSAPLSSPAFPSSSPPPATPSRPTQAQPQSAAVPPGQWIHTDQYGWIWMVYGDAHTYVPPSGSGGPPEYVYAPSYGWVWIVAPWMWGVGPRPYFGRPGPARFAWYAHGWWRHPLA